MGEDFNLSPCLNTCKSGLAKWWKHGTTDVNVLFFVQYFKDVDYDDNWTSERWLDLVFF